MKPRNLPPVVLDGVVGTRNWHEDFSDENGQYLGKCFQCGNWFIGHKHRMTCKLCDSDNKAKLAAMSTEEQQDAQIKMAEAAARIFGSSNPKLTVPRLGTDTVGRVVGGTNQEE